MCLCLCLSWASGAGAAGSGIWAQLAGRMPGLGPAEGRPQDLPEKLEAFYPPCVGGPERETGAWAGSLRISASERAAGCHDGTEMISSGDCRPLRAPTLCPLALTGTPPEPLVTAIAHAARKLYVAGGPRPHNTHPRPIRAASDGPVNRPPPCSEALPRGFLAASSHYGGAVSVYVKLLDP